MSRPRKKKPKSKRGGKREGAGRPSDGRGRQMSIYVRADTETWLRETAALAGKSIGQVVDDLAAR